MNMTQQLRHLSFILIAMASLHACSNKPSGGESAATNASSTIPQEWMSNMNDAYAQSVKDHKPILAYFTASDTCGLCKELEANILSTPLFKTWAEQNVVLLKVDFPENNQVPVGNNEQNSGMAKYLKVTSYPTLWMLNVTHEADNGRFKVKPIGRVGYESSPEKFVGMLQNFVRK